MPIERRISSGSPYERVVGFSRAVVAGGQVHVSATAPIMSDGGQPPAGAYGQTRRALEIVLAALHEAGASAAGVVRTRLYLTPAADAEGACRAHAEVFADVRPATGVIVVSGFLDPRWLVEIEVDAVLPAASV